MRSIFLGMLLALSGSACTHYSTFQANVPSPSEPPHGIVASGQGDAKAPPDLARVSLGVESRMPVVEQATADASGRMNAILAALKQAGIADKDLRTHSFSVGFEQDPVPPPMPVPAPTPLEKSAPAPSGVKGHYRVSNMLEVTIHDVAQVGRILQLATSAGANNVWGISFEIENPDTLREQARSEAIARAKRNAEELARLSGVKLGALISITENDMGGGYPMPMMKAMRDEANSSVPIEQGEISVNQQVQLIYAIEKP